MKSLLLVYENAAAEPMAALDGRTPLQVARCPAATRLAAEGLCGVLAKPPSGEGPRAEALLAALMGVPRADAWRLSRGALEAEAVGADWKAFNFSYRADLVTLDQGVMRDARLARLTALETESLVAALQPELNPMGVRLLPVGAGHAVALMNHADHRLDIGFAPWLLEGMDEAPRPEGRRHKVLREIMTSAAGVLAQQTINHVRVDLGENPASDLWLWGGGPRVELLEKFGGRPLKGVVLTQSAMARGLALSLGLEVRALENPWRVAETPSVVQPDEMAQLFKDFDMVVVYVEAPPELMEGSAGERVRLLERMDLQLTDPLLEAAKRVKHRRVVLATVPAAAPGGWRPRWTSLPVTVWGAHVSPDATARWDEESCEEGELKKVEPMDVFGRLVGG